MNLVEVKEVDKVFKERSLPVYALSKVSLDIQEGSFAALCGPSGSGKTTLLNLIGCLAKPTRGNVRLAGEDISLLSQDQLTRFRLLKIGFVFQDFNLIPTLSAWENIEYVLWLQRIVPAERARRIETIAKRFGIEKLLTRRPSRLSRGQQQRVAVARAIVHKPRIVLGDELTANLDHKTGTALMQFLKELNEEENITFLYASHDPVMIDLAKTIVKMQDGRILHVEKNVS